MGSPADEPIKVSEGVVINGLSDDTVDDSIHDVDPKEERAFVSALIRLYQQMINDRKGVAPRRVLLDNRLPRLHVQVY